SYNCISHSLHLHSFPTRRSSDLIDGFTRQCFTQIIYTTVTGDIDPLYDSHLFQLHQSGRSFPTGCIDLVTLSGKITAQLQANATVCPGNNDTAHNTSAKINPLSPFTG